ncbi:MAG: glycosyltransferase [Microscillaceae bacterium]|nr:glycosyltransferase [Microscillaceae bacterium]
MMPSHPLVSVIVPSYNAAHFLTQTLASVAAQSYPHWEVLVIDDGSTDETPALLSALAMPALRYHRQANQGVAAARNQGLALARGELIAFLDADDLFTPDNLQQKVEFLQAHPTIGLVHAAEEVFDSQTEQTLRLATGQGGKVQKALLEMRENVIHSPSSVLVRAHLLEQVGGFDTRLSTSADWEMWVRLAGVTDFGYLPQALVRYRVHSGQMHRNIRKMEQDMRYAFAKSHRAGFFESEKHYRYCRANLYLTLSACYWGDQRDYIRFARFFLRSLVTHLRPFWQRVHQRISKK